MTRLTFKITGGHPNLDIKTTLINFAKTHGFEIITDPFSSLGVFSVDAFHPQANFPLLKAFCKQHRLILTIIQREDITPCLY